MLQEKIRNFLVKFHAHHDHRCRFCGKLGDGVDAAALPRKVRELLAEIRIARDMLRKQLREAKARLERAEDRLDNSGMQASCDARDQCEREVEALEAELALIE